MENTIEKLNQNRLMELTEDDYQNIINNTVLKTLFLAKVKEGHEFVFEEAYELQEDLITPEYIIIVLDTIKKQQPDAYLRFFYVNIEEFIEEFPKDVSPIVEQYIADNLPNAIKLLETTDQIYERLENPIIIESIINNRLEKHYGSIYMDPPTLEFENLLLEALDTHHYKYIYTMNTKILEKCLETNNLSGAVYGVHLDNKEEVEIIFTALEEGKIDYDSLSHNFKEHYKEDLRIIKHKIRSEAFFYIDKELFEKDDVRKIIIEEIKRRPEISNDWSLIDAAEKYPDLALTIIKYWKTNNIENLINYKSEVAECVLKEHKEELIDAIIFNLEHNQSAIEEIINNMFRNTHYNPEIGTQIMSHPRFFAYYTSKLPLDKILNNLLSYEYDANPQYSINPEFYDLLANANVHFSKLPTNIKLEINYPENIWLALIPVLDSKYLHPNYLPIDRFVNSPKIFDCFLLRLKELKLNTYNSFLERWQGEITETLIELVLSQDNPLNLTSTQKLRILPMYKAYNSTHLQEIIENVDTIENEELCIMMQHIMNFDDVNTIKRIMPKILEKVVLNPKTIATIGGRIADVAGSLKSIEEGKCNIPEKFIVLYQCVEDFLRTQKEVPLSLTKYYSKEVADIASYSNPDNLVNNTELFNVGTTAPHHFVEYIKECQEKNLPIDLKLIHLAAHTSVSKKPYDYDNITFSDDEKTYEILHTLLNTSDPVKRKVISNWIDTKLTYEFFDCQMENPRAKLINLLVIQDEYTDKILKVINPDNIKDSTVLSNRLLEMLVTEQASEEIKNKVHSTIMALISSDKMNIFTANQSFNAYIELVTDPIFVDYVKRTFIPNITYNLQYLEPLLESELYKEETLKQLNRNKYNATNYYVTRLISTYPEIKQYVKDFLEEDTNEYTQFVDSYFNIDILPSYLKNHSIDKVIEFIVHNQNLNLITPELYNIIKEYLLIQHTEYKRESFEELERLFGKEILLLLESDNLKSLLSKNKDVVVKFTKLFTPRELSERIITTVNDSLGQNLFNIHNAHIINFFTNTLAKIQGGITDEEIREIINTVVDYIPDNLDEEIKKTGNELLLHTYKVNKHDFISILIQELINNQNTYAPLFNAITKNMIVKKRNEYRSTQDIYRDTNLTYELDTNSLYNALFNYLAKNDPEELISVTLFSDNDELNEKTIIFLSGHQEGFTQEELLAIKKNIPKLKKLFIQRIDELNKTDLSWDSDWELGWDDENSYKKFDNLPKRYNYLLNIPEFTKQVKKIPKFPPKKKITDIMGFINIPVFEQLAKDEEKYQALSALMSKYCFLEWDNLFEPTIRQLSIGEDTINLYNFINAFSKIYDIEKKIILRERQRLIDIIVAEMVQAGKSEEEINNYIEKQKREPINVQISPYKILKYSVIYSSIANYYKIILGSEDFELVKRNDTPNASYRNAEDRLQRASEMQIKMFDLNQVTVPSFTYEHTVGEEKKQKLAVTVGNRADSRNLTHGERTGACMRAYGHADSLFEFCNTDPRGFHITFTDPETNEYVSRVSCFRNGNTVFLNQLRESVSKKYTTQEVIEACIAVAKELIERSKDSDMPIENVVASTGYALSGYPTQQISPQNDISDGVYYGYRDVNNYAVVLATTGENGKAVEFKPDGTNQPVYEPVRLKPREYKLPNITESVIIQLQRITGIKECLENKDSYDYYKTLDFNYEILETEYLHVIIGQDWYVALDINGNLTHDIAVQNEHSIEELNEALAKMNKIKEDKMSIGGFTNGVQ